LSWSRDVPEATIVAAGCAWSALVAALGLANLIIALNFDFTTWAWFISFGSVGAKLTAFLLQYAVFRAITAMALVSMNLGPQNCGAVPGRLPTTRCGEEGRRLLRFFHRGPQLVVIRSLSPALEELVSKAGRGLSQITRSPARHLWL
jgi:hypothetical protein